MPLVIAVLIFVVILLNGKDANKNNARRSANRAKDSRKTNAELEQRVLDTYLKHGYSFDDAFSQTYQDMIKAGYEPCIPREAYYVTEDEDNVWSSFCSDGRARWTNGIKGRFCPGIYDSDWVKDRQIAVVRSWKANHGEDISSEKLDELTYTNFPTSEWAHQRDLNIRANMSKAEPVGTYVTYPGLGTCQVLGYNWIDGGASGGVYKLKVLKTGEMKYVKIGDDKIRRQGL